MNKQIDINDVVHAILRGMMDQHPSEITIGDFKLNCFYIASAAGKKHLAPTFQQATLKLAEWIEMYGLDHLSFSLWSIDEEGQPAKWTDLSSNEIFYLSVYNYLLKSRTPFESKGVVKFIDDKIIPAVMIDNYEEVYKDEILFRFFMDAPAMLCQDGIIRSRRELLEQYEFEEDDEIYERLMSSRASYTAAL